MARMTGGRMIAEMFKGYGVSHIFMVPAIIRHALAEMEHINSGIVTIQTHSEASAAYMADGFARASGRPGICMAQHVGTLNLAAGLRDAWLAKAPVIAITGGRDPMIKHRGAYQEVDDLVAFEPVTKLNATVDAVNRLPDMIRQAFRTAVTGVPGPVHLQIKGNEGQLDFEEGEAELYVEELFARNTPFRPEPSDASLAAAMKLIQSAERPVIVAGGGVRTSGAAAELVSLAEKLGIPVAVSLNGKDSIVGSHPLAVGVVGTYSRASANRTVSEADLVIFVGSAAGGMTTSFWRIPRPGVRVVQIDVDPEVFGMNYAVAAPVLGDAKIALSRMLAQADGGTAASRKSWLERVAAIKAEWRKEFSPLLESTAEPIRPERICHELTKHLPGDAIVMADTGHSGMWMSSMYDLNAPTQSYIRSAGHLGWSFAASLGAKCAQPDRPVIVFNGDSAFWYHIGEVETAVRMGINTITLVNNNRSGNQSKPGFDKAWGGEQSKQAELLWKFEDVNFATVADAMGAVGIRVEKASELESGLARALEVSKKKPVVLDIVSDIDAFAPLAYIP